MMKVGLLGASNSIVSNSWHNVISRQFNLSRFAAGSCNSGFGIYKAVENDLIEKNDLIIFNFGVSEHLELESGVVSAAHMSELTEALYKLSSASNKDFISLIFPLKKQFLEKVRDNSYFFHSKFALENGVYFIDGYYFLEKLAERLDYIEPSIFFLDDYHLHPVIAKYLGYAILEIINSKILGSKESSGEIHRRDYNIVGPDELEKYGYSKYRVYNSVFDENVIKIHKNETIEIYGEGYLHGIYLDCSFSEAKIKITSGTNVIIKNVSCRDAEILPNKSQMKFIPLKNNFYYKDKFSLEIANNLECVTEETRGQRPVTIDGESVSLCGFLISWGDVQHTRYKVGSFEENQDKIQNILNNLAHDCADVIDLMCSSTGSYVKKIKTNKIIDDDYLQLTNLVFRSFGHTSLTEHMKKVISEKESQILRTDYEILKSAKALDEKFYLQSYPDIKNAGVDPIKHYCEHGHKEGRDPSPSFSTTAYRRKKNLHSSTNPLIHYLVNELGVSDRF